MSRFVGPDVTLVGVDVVPRYAGLSPRIEWVRSSSGGAATPSLEWLAGRRALVVAHEWLDVVPCTIAEVYGHGILRAVLVEGADRAVATEAPDGEAGEDSRSAVEVRERLGDELKGDEAARWWPAREPGECVDIGLTRDEAWENLISAVAVHAAPGSVVLGIEYVVSRDEPSPFGALTGFRDGVDCSPAPDGTCDLTVHVMLDSLDVEDATRTSARSVW